MTLLLLKVPDLLQIPGAQRVDERLVVQDLREAVFYIGVLRDLDQMDLLVKRVLLTKQPAVARDPRDLEMEIQVSLDALIDRAAHKAMPIHAALCFAGSVESLVIDIHVTT